ncbi:MAG: hypothetical protein WCS37_11635 [Chloroflexota bacterium]|nr:hypothetical protein [Chloroflexota bacterium]
MVKVSRWIARILGLLFNLVALLLIGLTLNPLRDYPLQELPALLALLVANAGIVMAWKWEVRGGLVACVASLITGVAIYFSALSIGESQKLALIVALVYGLPYLLVGALFLFCHGRAGVGVSVKEPKLTVSRSGK